MMDDEAKADQMNVRISGKKLRKILTEQQRTELEKQLEVLHGERHYILGKELFTSLDELVGISVLCQKRG